MSLILSGDPRLDPQENLLLKSMITCFGMQCTNMPSTRLQDKNRGRLSSQIKLIILMTLTMNLEKITRMIQRKMIHLHIQFFNPLSTLLTLRNNPKSLFPCQLWGEFPEATKQMIINYNKKIKVANAGLHFNGGNTKPKSTLGQSNPNPQPSS